MEAPSLQTILRQNYNINDMLLAEGRFVGLVGEHAASLVCLGLGIRCLVIAKVVLSGDVIDYDLLSLLPLRTLSLSYQNIAKKIKIRSQFKQTQVYQMCTSANQAEVWDNFTSTIREVYLPEQGDIWCSPTLLPLKVDEHSPRSFHKDKEIRSTIDSDYVYSSQNESPFSSQCLSRRHSTSLSKTNSVDHNQSSAAFSQFSSVSNLSTIPFTELLRFDPRLSGSVESLPVKLPSQADDRINWFKDTKRSQSMFCLDIKFESFVNDVPKVLRDQSEASLTCSSADDTIQISEETLNISNNFKYVRDVSDISLNDASDTRGRSDGRFSRFFGRLLSCCSVRPKRK